MDIKLFLGLSLLGITQVGFADVVVDNFNDIYTSQTTLGNNLGVAAHAGYYYAYTDSADGGDTRMVPDVTTDKEFTTAVVATGGHDASKFLHIVTTLGPKNANPYGAFAFNIKDDGEYVDLTAMTGVTLWAKGAGTVRVKFQTFKVTSYPAGTNWGDMGTDLVLTADWKQYTITPAMIVPQPYSPQASDGVKWDDCKAKVGKMIFQTGPGLKSGVVLDLSLDDVVMTGVTPTTFGGSWIETAGILSPNGAPAYQSTLQKRDAKSARGVFSLFSRGSFFDFSGRQLP